MDRIKYLIFAVMLVLLCFFVYAPLARLVAPGFWVFVMAILVGLTVWIRDTFFWRK